MLIGEQARIKESRAEVEGNSEQVIVRLMQFLELAKSAYLSYKAANDAERRELVEMTVSNFRINGNSLSVTLNSPFDRIAVRHDGPDGCPIELAEAGYFSNLTRIIKPTFEILLPKPRPGHREMAWREFRFGRNYCLSRAGSSGLCCWFGGVTLS